MAEADRTHIYRIGTLATRTGLTPDTIRYYERLGLLPPPARTSGGFRLYTDRALARLRFITQAKALDLSLEEIRDLVAFDGRGGVRRCRRMRDLLAGKLDAIEQKLAGFRELRRTLSAALARCDAALDGTGPEECPVIEDLDRQERPAPRRARPGQALHRRS